MKAIVYSRYGPPEVAELHQVATPTPRSSEVLVNVRASVLGPADCAFRAGIPRLARLYAGLRRPRFPILGGTLAGDVTATGDAVRRFAPGDRVWALSPNGFGAHAEYLCLSEQALLAPMPAGMDYEDAVSVLEAATALTFLRDVARLQAGQRILVNGASGAVGAFGVQLAAHFGAHVTGVCSTANAELVASLGADEVVDYTTEDFTRAGRRYDVIFDAVAKSSFSRCLRTLAPNGQYLSTDLSLGTAVAMLWTAVFRGRRARFAASGLRQTAENLTYLGGLFTSGALRPVVDRRYPLNRIAEAYRYVETGRKKGTVAITPPEPEHQGGAPH